MSAKYLALNDAIYNYVLAHRSNANDPVLQALQVETQNLGEISQMAISPDQGSLIGLLVAISGTKWAAEIGTFTGYSSIAMAAGLPDEGRPEGAL